MQRDPGTCVPLSLLISWLGFELYFLCVLLNGDSFWEMSHSVSGQQAAQCPFPLRTPGAKSDHAFTTRSARQHQLFCSSAPEMNFQTPLTDKARALCNVLRSSEVWGNERKRIRLGTLKQKESVHHSSLGRKWRGVMTVRYSPVC